MRWKSGLRENKLLLKILRDVKYCAGFKSTVRGKFSCLLFVFISLLGQYEKFQHFQHKRINYFPVHRCALHLICSGVSLYEGTQIGS